MTELANLTEVMNGNIMGLMKQAWRIAASNPPMARFVLRTFKTQAKAAKRRTMHEARGVHVPPFLIVSVTNRCNLKCKGCYSAAQHRSPEGEMTDGSLRDLLGEARDLGVSFALLAGGEPLVRPDVIRIAAEFREMVFPVFTNGLLLDDDMVAFLSSARNIVPVVSIEGDRRATDDRRGAGVFQQILSSMASMRARGLFFGASITVTRANYDQVTGPSYIQELLDSGTRLVFLIEYVPVDEGTQDLALTQGQREGLSACVKEWREDFASLFISFPGDEDEVGGCLAAGRGFVHISARGDVEPCPFTPWSDASLSGSSLTQALKSPFLAAIRDNHDALGETTGGCALWAKRDLVEELLRSEGA